MNANDVFLLVVRWLHLLAATAWVGGSLFYLLVLQPSLSRFPGLPGNLKTTLSAEFRAVVVTCVVILVSTGVILAFERLTVGVVGAPYAVTLGVKVALSVWMFLLVRDRRRQSRILQTYVKEPRTPRRRLVKIVEAVSGYNTVVILGITVFLLADLLKVLFDTALSRG